MHVEWGDVEAAFAAAAHIAEGEFYFPMVYAYAMEPYVAIADYDAKGQLTVYSSAQHPFMVRHDLAEVFGLPLNSVRVIVPYVGGGYGSKSYTKIEPLVAACSWKAGRPVKLQLSVEEAFLTTRGDDARVRIRTAVDAKGQLVARQATIHLNTGAYAENSPMVCRKAANRIVGPYRIPNVKIDCLAVYTNTVPASSYRGLGAAQVTFPGESQIDELAEKSGCDPVEFRLKNLAQSRESIHPGMRPIDADVAGRCSRGCPDVADGSSPGARTWALGVLLGERCRSASGDAGDGAGLRGWFGIGAERKHGDRPGQPHRPGSNRGGRNGSAAGKGQTRRFRHCGDAVRTLHRREPDDHVDGPRGAGSVPRGYRTVQGDGG